MPPGTTRSVTSGLLELETQLRAEIEELFLLSEQSDQRELPDGLLGYLPLAVELTGAQLRRKHPEMWLHSFAIHKLKAPRADPKNIHDSLEETFRLSLNELHESARGLYVALAIFKEDEAVPPRRD